MSSDKCGTIGAQDVSYVITHITALCRAAIYIAHPVAVSLVPNSLTAVLPESKPGRSSTYCHPDQSIQYFRLRWYTPQSVVRIELVAPVIRIDSPQPTGYIIPHRMGTHVSRMQVNAKSNKAQRFVKNEVIRLINNLKIQEK